MKSQELIIKQHKIIYVAFERYILSQDSFGLSFSISLLTNYGMLASDIGSDKVYHAIVISIVGFAGTDPIKNDSGDKVSDSKPSSKRGSPYLARRFLSS